MNFDLLEPQQGDNLDAAQASLAANGRSGSVVEGLIDRTDLISRGDSRGGGKADTSLAANLQGVHVPRRDGDGFLGGGDNLDAVQAILAANGRSGSVVEGLVGRSDLISRGDSRGAALTMLIVSLLGRTVVTTEMECRREFSRNGGGSDGEMAGAHVPRKDGDGLSVGGRLERNISRPDRKSVV